MMSSSSSGTEVGSIYHDPFEDTESTGTRSQWVLSVGVPSTTIRLRILKG